jgi:acyl transferase domain-containing protein
MTSRPAPIAVVGIGCRFPGNATDPTKLWNLLASGKTTWTEVPADRYNEQAFYHPNADLNGSHNHRGGHFLDQNIAAFDADFFGISPIEAQAMDPQHRILLETSYEALENSGHTLESVRGSKTSVYTAIFTRDYDRNIYKDTFDIPKYHITGSGEAILSNRVSHFFDLRGPSMTLDTGCSGSMVAVHQACQSLRTHESTMALAGGVNLILNPDHMIGMSNLQSV